MKKYISLAIVTLVFTSGIYAQKVANYSFGTPGTENYESFSFWTKNGKRSTVSYTYGADRKETKVAYLSKTSVGGQKGFKVRFANNYTLFIVPYGDKLKITDAAGKYSKEFAWEYEGPIDGRGTFCEPCAPDEKQAIALIKTYYLK